MVKQPPSRMAPNWRIDFQVDTCWHPEKTAFFKCVFEEASEVSLGDDLTTCTRSKTVQNSDCIMLMQMVPFIIVKSLLSIQYGYHVIGNCS